MDTRQNGAFRFINPGRLIDGDLELILTGHYPGDPTRHWVPAYRFKMTCDERREEIGAIELRVGDNHNTVLYGGHIGYSVDPEHRGHRFAARSVRLLLPLARAHGMKTVWITCNPNNAASRRSCELAGARLVDIIDLPEDNDMYREGDRQKCRYRIDLGDESGVNARTPE